MSKPFSQACENNKHYILPALMEYFRNDDTVLEIGTGTAQHIMFFAENLPEVTWIPTDTLASMPVMHAGLDKHLLENIDAPLQLDVMQDSWMEATVNGVFSANTLHIMSAQHVEKFFTGVGKILEGKGFLLVYGPFNYEGKYTSDSNAQFDQWLAARDPQSAIRDFEWVNELAENEGLSLMKDHDMPANNRLLVWQKQ